MVAFFQLRKWGVDAAEWLPWTMVLLIIPSLFVVCKSLLFILTKNQQESTCYLCTMCVCMYVRMYIFNTSLIHPLAVEL